MYNFPPMISAEALGDMPLFAFEQFGESKTEKLLNNAGLPFHLLDDRRGFIPVQAFANFVSAVARDLGHDKLGLLWSPYLTVADYGTWGQYLLSAPTLGDALRRSVSVMPYHSNTDRLTLRVSGDFAALTYCFALKSHAAYADIAYSALAVVLSIHRHFLGPSWRPNCIWMDMSRPHHAHQIEEAFGCPVRFDRTALCIWFDAELLGQPNVTQVGRQQITIEDVQRERVGGPAKTYVGAVRDIILVHLNDENVSVERAAEVLQTSTRSLQRKLSIEGMTFRELTGQVKMQRATELLAIKGNSVTSVAMSLGYNSPGNFGRAFSSQLGCSPRQFMSSVRGR